MTAALEARKLCILGGKYPNCTNTRDVKEKAQGKYGVFRESQISSPRRGHAGGFLPSGMCKLTLIQNVRRAHYLIQRTVHWPYPEAETLVPQSTICFLCHFMSRSQPETSTHQIISPSSPLTHLPTTFPSNLPPQSPTPSTTPKPPPSPFGLHIASGTALGPNSSRKFQRQSSTKLSTRAATDA
ncbi:MAG: hypothetical protein Q9193_005088 [Seirophora villosa]